MPKFQEPDEHISELDFTNQAEDMFFDAVDDIHFNVRNYNIIYNALKKKARIIPFGDFLKRYIYEKAEIQDDYNEVSDKDYCSMICDSFVEHQTPASFTSTTMRIKNLARNWLKQETVSRNVVLLLGFGLNMSTEDVDMFLTKVLKEQRLYAKDPFEVICWYCYTYKKSYTKFDQLWKQYQECDSCTTPALQSFDSTYNFKQRMIAIRNEDQLMRYLKGLPIAPGTKRQSIMARKQFDNLYTETRNWIAEYLTEAEEREFEVRKIRLSDELDRKNCYNIIQKKEILKKADSEMPNYTGSDISPAQMEQVIFPSVPKDKNGNLSPIKSSSLSTKFAGNRLTRQRLKEIIAGEAQITRYDLITMGFLAFVRKADNYEDRKKRYWVFLDYINNILEESNMTSLYLVNPYECFIAMCILSDDPMNTFSDVWGLSYNENLEV